LPTKEGGSIIAPAQGRREAEQKTLCRPAKKRGGGETVVAPKGGGKKAFRIPTGKKKRELGTCRGSREKRKTLETSHHLESKEKKTAVSDCSHQIKEKKIEEKTILCFTRKRKRKGGVELGKREEKSGGPF